MPVDERHEITCPAKFGKGHVVAEHVGPEVQVNLVTTNQPRPCPLLVLSLPASFRVVVGHAVLLPSSAKARRMRP